MSQPIIELADKINSAVNDFPTLSCSDIIDAFSMSFVEIATAISKASGRDIDTVMNDMFNRACLYHKGGI